MSIWHAALARRSLPRIQISRASAIAIGATVAFAIVTLLALDLGNDLLVRFYWVPDSWRIFAPFALAFIAAGLFAGARYEEFQPLLKASIRASAVGLLVLLIVEAPEYTLANPATASRAAAYVQMGYPFALACAVAGIFRPSFVVPVAIYLLSMRHLVYAISGLPISFLDIRYMVDMALYLSIFGIAALKLGPRLHPWLGSTDRQAEIVGVGFGVHLANYFWSGVGKVAIGPTPWYWIFDNHTYNQIPHTIESGILPIGHIPWLSQFAYDAFKLTYIPLNAIIVFVQLFALLCVFRINWLKITSVLFDLLHLGIYILGGLFFWPWIWNNLTIWWAARSNKKNGLATGTKVACVTAILLGFPAFKTNEAAWLAWYDVAEARQVYFEAVTADGHAVKVPSAFFLSHSYSVSHAYMGQQDIPGQYEHTMLASARTLERNERTETCPPPETFPVRPDRLETPEQHGERQATLGRFLAAHHAKMLEREAAFGKGSWYFHAHHHPSNPFLYGEFNNLSLNDVVGYNLVYESNCHSLHEGKVVKRTWKRDTEYYDVR